MTSFVYFMQPIGGGPIRIGYSTAPSKRLSHLTSYSPVRLEIITQFRASQYIEVWLHDHFREDRLHGEWFAPSFRLFEIIDSVKRTGWHPVLPRVTVPKWNLRYGRRAAENFRRIRKVCFGLTVEDFAEELEVSPGTVRGWEQDGPSHSAVVKSIRIAESLGKSVSFADFFGAERVETR